MPFLAQMAHKINKNVKILKYFKKIFTVACTKGVARIYRQITRASGWGGTEFFHTGR